MWPRERPSRAAWPASLPIAASNPCAPPREEIPWSEREERRKAAKVSAIARARRYEPVQRLLTAVVLHLAVMRKRYMSALGQWAQLWLQKRDGRVEKGHRLTSRRLGAACARPCSGSACVAARAAGLAGFHTLETYIRCPRCRQTDRSRELRAYLLTRLGPRGSTTRRSLHDILPLDELGDMLSSSPGGSCGIPMRRLARRVSSLSGVPYRDDAGEVVAARAAWLASVQDTDAVSAGNLPCSGCSRPNCAVRCARCTAAWCAPGPRSCTLLPEAYFLEVDSALILLCPDCARTASRLAAATSRLAAPAGPASPAAVVMDRLSDSPTTYPSVSASLVDCFPEVRGERGSYGEC